MVDIVIAVDESSSVTTSAVGGHANWRDNVLPFVERVATAFDIGDNKAQVGLLKFNDDATEVLQLTSDSGSALGEIRNLQTTGGNTNFAAALKTARSMLSNGRPRVPDILVLITGGSANVDQELTIPEATRTKDAGVTIFTVGVTDQTDEQELRTIASSPDFYIDVDNFPQLNSILHQLVDKICEEGEDPEPPKCHKAADIVLVVDESASITQGDVGGHVNWNVHVRSFVEKIATAFSIGDGPYQTKVGLLEFNDDARVIFQLTGDRESVVSTIRSMSTTGGNTNFAAALRTARSMFTTANGARPDKHYILIMITDGTPTAEIEHTYTEAEQTKDDNIWIFTVGITNKTNEEELRRIATSPQYYFPAEDFEHLNYVLHDVVETSCRVIWPRGRRQQRGMQPNFKPSVKVKVRTFV